MYSLNALFPCTVKVKRFVLLSQSHSRFEASSQCLRLLNEVVSFETVTLSKSYSLVWATTSKPWSDWISVKRSDAAPLIMSLMVNKSASGEAFSKQTQIAFGSESSSSCSSSPLPSSSQMEANFLKAESGYASLETPTEEAPKFLSSFATTSLVKSPVSKDVKIEKPTSDDGRQPEFYCICKRRVDSDEDEEEDIMIECDACKDWLHGRFTQRIILKALWSIFNFFYSYFHILYYVKTK